MHELLIALSLSSSPGCADQPLEALEVLGRAVAEDDRRALAWVTTPRVLPRDAGCDEMPTLLALARRNPEVHQSLVHAARDAVLKKNPGDEAHVAIGPVRPSMHGLCLRRVKGCWKVAGWTRGG